MTKAKTGSLSNHQTQESGPRSQFGNPRGWLGRLALISMAWKDGRYNGAARNALDLQPGDQVWRSAVGRASR